MSSDVLLPSPRPSHGPSCEHFHTQSIEHYKTQRYDDLLKSEMNCQGREPDPGLTGGMN